MEALGKKNDLNYNFPMEENTCFFVRDVKEGECLERCFSEKNMLFYLYSGKIELFGDGRDRHVVSTGYFFVLPKNESAYGKVLKDAVLVGCLFTNDLHLFSWPLLARFARSLSENFTYKFSTLKSVSSFHAFYKALLYLLESGVTEINFHKLKREELFLYLRTFYSRKKLAFFFYPILGCEMDFKDFVLSNYHHMKDVQQFAEEANMTLSTFNRHFKEVFNEPAYQWMQSNKAEKVRISIVTTDASFTEIALEYGFSSPAHLTAFCKKSFGLTPTALRKQGVR